MMWFLIGVACGAFLVIALIVGSAIIAVRSGDSTSQH